MASLRELGFEIPKENVRPEFTPWIPWTERLTVDEEGYKLHEYSGVYLLAHIDGTPPRGDADPMDRRIIYVGEGGGFKQRWYNFQRSVGHKPGHSGGHAYRLRYKQKTPLETLYVSAFPVWLKKSEPDPDPTDPRSLTCRLRHYVEQGLLWHHYYAKAGSELLNRK